MSGRKVPPVCVCSLSCRRFLKSCRASQQGGTKRDYTLTAPPAAAAALKSERHIVLFYLRGQVSLFQKALTAFRHFLSYFFLFNTLCQDLSCNIKFIINQVETDWYSNRFIYLRSDTLSLRVKRIKHLCFFVHDVLMLCASTPR